MERYAIGSKYYSLSSIFQGLQGLELTIPAFCYLVTRVLPNTDTGIVRTRTTPAFATRVTFFL